MSSNVRSSPKCLSTNESNIPISRRFHVDSAKRSKKRNDVPELQRYIETIVKAQNDYDRENSKGQKSAKKVLEKSETTPQSESGKQNEIKAGGNTKTRSSDDAGGGTKVCEEGIKKMDNPYESDTNPILEIERFLRKLYPNPYDLEKVSEFQVLKASENIREICGGSDSSKPNSSFLDVIPSSVDGVDVTCSRETLVSQISTNSFLKADIFIGENMVTQNSDDIFAYSTDDYFVSNTLESVICSEVITTQNDDDSTTDDSKVSCLLRNKIESRVSSPPDKLRSRPSSAESEIRHFHLDNPTGVSKKRNSSRRINAERPSKAMPSKNKSEALVVLGKQHPDNLSKLNMISSYESNEIIQGDTVDERSMCEEAQKIENGKKASGRYTKNPTELHQLYHVMDKTAESILHITTRNQNDTCQDRKPDNHAKSSDVSRKNSARDLETVSSSDGSQRTRRSQRRIEKSLKNKSTLIAAFQRERSKGEKEKNLSKPETSTDGNDFGGLSEKDHRIDDVLQYMCDCLRKITNDNMERTRDDNDVTVSENIENEKPKSGGRSERKDTKRTSREGGNTTNVVSRDIKTPTANQNDNSQEGCCSLEVVGHKNSTPDWSLETEKVNKKLSPGRQHRKKRPLTPQSPTKSCCSEENTLELSAVSVPSSSERLVISSPPTRRPEIPDVIPNNESMRQIVERQNELGGYNEEQPRELEVPRESQPKSLYPVRFRKQKRDSCRILKNALDTEEKLLADNLLVDDEPSNDVDSPSKQSRSSVRSPTLKPSPYALMNEIKQQRSGFVICVSSMPRHLRTGHPTKMPQASSLSMSVNNLGKPLEGKKVRNSKAKKLKKLSLEPWVEHMGRHHTYRFEVDLLLTLQREYIIHTATVVGLAHVYATSLWEEDVVSRDSQCYVRVKSPPLKKSLFVENLNVPVPSSSGISIGTRGSPERVTSSGLLFLQREGMEEGEDAEIEDTASERTLLESEENILGLGQNNESEQTLTYSGTSITYVVQNESSETRTVRDGERDRKKIQDLLLRTYHLQHKLHRYLHRISYPRLSSHNTPKENGARRSDEGELFPAVSATDLQAPSPSTENKDSQVYWLLEPNSTKETQTKEHEVQTEVEKVDHSTSYHPLSKTESSRSLKEDAHGEDDGENEETGNLENDDDSDDRSSTYSFKSSNDFSESNEVVNAEEKPKVQKSKNKNSRFLEKIFQELELFRKTITAIRDKTREETKPETKPSTDDSIVLDRPKTGHVIERRGEGKPAGKALRTVFKGKESTTELTIGLRDVPITEGSNISVEKKKFSQNHTKISISISKENPEDLCDVTRRYFKFATDNIRTTLSSYYFDSLRPTISECETRYTRLETDGNKSENDFDGKEEEEEEEEEEERDKEEEDDDYKSVASSISSKSDTDKPEERESDEKTAGNGPKPSPTKPHTKHRFDFYRKMTLDADYDEDRTKKAILNNVSRYKELEPLKEALTEMQLKMRNLKRNSYFSSSEYYQRALKLAKMSAGFCQSCGSRSVVPDNSFVTCRTLLPRRSHTQCRKHYLNGGVSTYPNPSYYSFRSSSGDLRTRFCDLDLCQSSYILRGPGHSSGPILGDVPIFRTRM